MTNKLLNLGTATLIALSLSACADREILQQDDPVVQVNDLADYDSDGVIKARDKCAETTLGASIDNYGCGQKVAEDKSFNLNILFANDSFELSAYSFEKIDALAKFLTENPKAKVVIEGHTSKQGSYQHNMQLSKNRAQAVVNVLVEKYRIAADRVSSVGYGFEQLLDQGNTKEAHAVNRRIIAEISASDEYDVMEWTIYSVDQSL